MDLNKKLEELKPYQLNCNVFDVYSYNGLTMQDLLCQFFTKINECITVSNETIDLAKWLVNEGLEIEVVKKLMIWLEDGTLENIINVNIFNTLNEKINGLSSQLEQITINVRDFGAKCDGVTDDTEAIQNCIDFVSKTLLVNEIKEKRYGRILLPPGVICISSINLHSNIILEGSGIYSTRLKPISPNVDLINVVGVSYGNMIIFTELKNMSISPNDDLRGVGNEISLTSVIKLENSQRCRLNNVVISDINGIGLNNLTNMDCYIDKVEIINVSTPIYFGNSCEDVSNAIHISDSRFEINTNPIIFEGTTNRYIREIYFNNCKFERTQFKFSNTLHINFSNCHFTDTYGNTTFTIDDTYNVGINVNGGSITSGSDMTHKICENNSNYYVNFNGVSVSNCHNSSALFTGKNIKIINCDFIYCTHPIVDVENVIFNNNTTKNLHPSDGSKYVVILHDNSICCNNILYCVNGIYMGSGNSVTDNLIRSEKIGYYLTSSGNFISDRGDGSISSTNTSLLMWNKINRELTSISGNKKYLSCSVGVNNSYGSVTYVDLSDIKKSVFNVNQISCEINGVNTSNEIVTMKFEFFGVDGTSTSIEKVADRGNLGTWLNDDDFYNLYSNNKIAVTKVGISAKSNQPSTNATAKSKIVIS